MALKNSQYDTIMREYEQKQLHSQDVLNAHYQRVYDCIPEIRDLENAISHLSVQKARNLLEGDETALSSLKEEISMLRQKKSALLSSYGFPEDYLEPSYECADCKDTGYIGSQKCHCFKKATIRTGIPQSVFIWRYRSRKDFSLKLHCKGTNRQRLFRYLLYSI